MSGAHATFITFSSISAGADFPRMWPVFSLSTSNAVLPTKPATTMLNTGSAIPKPNQLARYPDRASPEAMMSAVASSPAARSAGALISPADHDSNPRLHRHGDQKDHHRCHRVDNFRGFG